MLLFGLLLLISIGGAFAVTQLPSDDAEVLEDTPGTNFGTLNETLMVSRSTHADISYWAFDFSNVSATLDSAIFDYYIYTVSGQTISNYNASFYYCDDAGFDETTITWNTRNADVTNCDATPVYQKNHNDYLDNKAYQFDIKAKVNSEISAGDKKFVIKGQVQPLTSAVSKVLGVASKESVSNIRPRINYTYSFSFDNTYPIQDDHYSYYNGSIVVTSLLSMYCRVNDSNWTIVGAMPSTSLQFKNTKIPVGENAYKVFVQCNQSTNSSHKYNKTVQWVVDRTYPSNTLISPINNSYHNINFPLTIRYYDIYLYATNTTIKKPSGAIVWRRHNQSMTGTQLWHNISTTFSVTNGSITDGNYSILMTSADTHTALEFSEIPALSYDKVTITDKASKIDLNRVTLDLKYGDVSLTYPLDMEITTEKEKDRVIFNYDSKEIGISEYILSAKKMVYYPDSPYKGHFVLNDKYWYDTEGLEDATIQKIDDNNYRILFNKREELVKSRSLGGLNERNTTAYFYVDKTIPTTKNSTQVFGFQAILRLNASEKIQYNLTLMRNNCSGTIISTKANTTLQNFTIIKLIGGMINNTRYVAKTTIRDIANNTRDLCINFTTHPEEHYIYNYSWISELSAGILRFRVRGFDSLEHPFIFNWTLWHNGKPDQSFIRNYINVTESTRQYAFNDNGTYLSNDLKNGFYGCINLSNQNILLRIRADNLGNQSVNASCLSEAGWQQISSDFNVFQVNENRIKTSLDNGTTIYDLSPSNYSRSGQWVNFSNMFDGNLSTYAYCDNGFEDCYAYLTYPTYILRMYYSNVTYQLVNITNITTGTYSMIINMFDGSDASESVNVSLDITFTVSLYDEMTGVQINGTSFIDFISDDPVITEYNSFNTTTGTFTITGLNFLDYNVLYWSNGYEKRHFYVAKADLVINGSFKLFLLNVNYSGFSVIRVVDENYQPVEMAKVYVMKSIPNFNEKQIVSIIRTNFEGEATLDFRKYTDNYQFLVYVNDRLVKVSQETQISKDTIVIQVKLGDDVFDSIKMNQGSLGYITVANGTTSNRTCYFTYGGADIVGGRLDVEMATLGDNTQVVCSESSVSSTDTISCDFNITIDRTYLCKGYVDTNTTGSWYLKALISVSRATGRNVLGRLGLLIGFLITISLAFLFREHPTSSIVITLIGLSFVGLSGMISIPWAGLVMIIIVGGIFAYKMKG